MMKEIQEKRIENELSLLKESKMPYKLKKINKEEYQIEVSLPSDRLSNENIKKDIIFLIHMLPNFPFNSPQVFCKSPVFLLNIVLLPTHM
jgi:ubiquitin-protein ligase